LTWPVETEEVNQANLSFPERPVESGKAWKEMVHRYLAGALVLLVAAINIMAWRPRARSSGVRLLTAVLLALIIFQAALGMWTVTLKLLPIVVMGHLMGGLATLSLLLWLVWKTGEGDGGQYREAFRPFRVLIVSGLLVLFVQLALGGWTSANYSALACPDFPTCQGKLWPDSNFGDGFVLWRKIGVDYEGGVLDLPSRTAIHMAHRIGAVVTLVLLGFLALRLLMTVQTRTAGAVLGIVLLAQVTFGILNVWLFLPLPNAVAHNGTGALLLAVMMWLAFKSTRRTA
jgi:cytochrome c oxidase assembly protein subunit 15